MLYVLEEFELQSRRATVAAPLVKRRGAQFLRDVDHQRPSQACLPSVHGRTHGGRFALPLHLGCCRAARLLRRAPGRTNADLSTTTTIARAAAAAPEEADVVHLRRVRADGVAAPALSAGAAAVGVRAVQQAAVARALGHAAVRAHSRSAPVARARRRRAATAGRRRRARRGGEAERAAYARARSTGERPLRSGAAAADAEGDDAPSGGVPVIEATVAALRDARRAWPRRSCSPPSTATILRLTEACGGRPPTSPPSTRTAAG